MSKKRLPVSDEENRDATAPKGGDDDPNVDKIRDILFGGQMRDYERRFSELDARLAANIERLSKDLETRMDKLEAYFARELEALTERLGQEKTERITDRDAAGEQLRELGQQALQQISALDEQSSTEARSIRAALLQQSNEMADLLRETRDALAAETKAQAQSLDDRKVAREDLAAMLSEVALRLNREFDLPDSE